MLRFKTLGVLAATFFVLALTASPASAIWESSSTQTTGAIHPILPMTYKYGPNAEIKCSVEGFKGLWQIQGVGQIKQQQKTTTEGPHLQIQVKSWGTCTAKFGVVTEGANFSECTFQLVQQRGIPKATFGVSKESCLFATTFCLIQIPIGMEEGSGSGKGINVGLKEVELSNIGANQLDKVKVTSGGTGQLVGAGIFAQSVSGSGMCPLAHQSEEGTLEGEFEAIGVKMV